MEKLKRFVLRFQTPIFFSLVAVVALLGCYVGYSTVDQYTTLVDAALGLTVLYFLYREFLIPRKNVAQPSGIRLKFPRDLKYLLYAFVAAIVGFWASVQVLALFGI